jgi:polar amino acid transport system substrate-binding protein
MFKLPIVFVLVLSSTVAASTERKLSVLVSNIEPCVIVSKENKVSGFDIDLWEAVAKKKNISFEYKVVEFKDLLNMLVSGDGDIGVSAITINSIREKNLDFTHHYMDAGLGILVPQTQKRGSVWDFRYLTAFFTSLCSTIVPEFLMCLGAFFFIMSNVLWFFEKGHGQISLNYFKGIGQGLYFCIVTASTVGYGDITPKKIVGRLAAAILILTGVAFFANFTIVVAESQRL